MPKTERLICFMRLTLVYNTHTHGKEINKYTHTHTSMHVQTCAYVCVYAIPTPITSWAPQPTHASQTAAAALIYRFFPSLNGF